MSNHPEVMNTPPSPVQNTPCVVDKPDSYHLGPAEIGEEEIAMVTQALRSKNLFRYLKKEEESFTRRFEKEFAKAVGRVISLQKNKCRAFHAVDDGSWDERVIDEWRALGNWREIPGSRFMTRAGVFSCDHIDPGSHLLAMHLPANLRGIVADLGAGWGYLADAALRGCPKIDRLDLFEADARALACARHNLAGHARAIHYHWHDVTTGLPGTYDAIIMNPPFHTGQASDVDLGRAFLLTAATALRRGGKLFLVANRQLPYEAVLDAAGLAWRITAENPTYKLLFAYKR